MMNEDGHLTELTRASDAELVARARGGDCLAFGVLYLRHHEAAWRVACAVTGFTDDAEVALLDGFTTVFAALPREPGDAMFRPYLLACVRRAGVGRLQRLRPTPAAPVTDEIVLEDELVLSELEHHLVRSALRQLPERGRTTLWLTDVEGMTPKEVAAVVGLDPDAVPGLAAEARTAVRRACIDGQRHGDVPVGCQFTVYQLESYLSGGLELSAALGVTAHLDRCIPCRMRRAELARMTQSLAGAVPVTPVLGGECQRYWMESARHAGGARRTLPPALAAGAVAPDRRRPVPLASLAVASVAVALAFALGRLASPGVTPPPDQTALTAPAGSVVGSVAGITARPGPTQPSPTRSSPTAGAAVPGAPAAVAPAEPPGGTAPEEVAAPTPAPAVPVAFAVAGAPVEELEETAPELAPLVVAAVQDLSPGEPAVTARERWKERIRERGEVWANRPEQREPRNEREPPGDGRSRRA